MNKEEKVKTKPEENKSHLEDFTRHKNVIYKMNHIYWMKKKNFFSLSELDLGSSSFHFPGIELLFCSD